MARAKRMNAPFEERLWAKIDKRGDDECWPWRASLSTTGYGQIKNGSKIVRAHNAVCRLAHGEPMGDQHALHSCDNKLCCNPKHLSWGDRYRNMQEARDRSFVGKQRLSREQADAIKASAASVSSLCAEYGISRWQVTNIRSGRQWNNG